MGEGTLGEIHSASGIVLAAGVSSRMGDLKPLLPLGGRPAVVRAAETLLGAGIRDVVVVVGYRSEEVMAALDGLPVRTALNEDYVSGMFSSVRRGIQAIWPSARAFFLLPADIPLVSADTLRSLACALFEHDMRPEIVYPCRMGHHGHPPLISTVLRDRIIDWDGPGGLRGVLERRQDRALNLEVDDPGILMDMDTRDDYLRLVQYYSGGYEEAPDTPVSTFAGTCCGTFAPRGPA